MREHVCRITTIHWVVKNEIKNDFIRSNRCKAYASIENAGRFIEANMKTLENGWYEIHTVENADSEWGF